MTEVTLPQIRLHIQTHLPSNPTWALLPLLWITLNLQQPHSYKHGLVAVERAQRWDPKPQVRV